VDKREQTIYDFQDRIIEIYKEKSIKSLSGINLEYKVNGRDITPWYFDVVRKGRNQFKHFDFQKWFDDIIFCSDEILHFTALLYLYGPYMNNPLKEGYKLGERTVYPNRQNLPAKRFSMYANSTTEKVYNFWDRIGDLLATYFPDEIKSKNVYFAPTIDSIPEAFQNSENYKWLKKFKESEFKEMNERRIQIVHYTTLDTQFKHTHLEYSDDEAMLNKLITERDKLPDFFNNHIQTTLDGFERTILFIEELNKTKFASVDLK
jgi:Cthe_2314-like HEPN